MKILVVDDEVNIRTPLIKFLQMEGFQADGAENGLSAQRLIRYNNYDGIVLDLKMPGMNGHELVKWIVAEGYKVPIIMISAHGEIPDAVNLLKDGASDYVMKPFDPEVLVEKIKNLVESANISKIAKADVKVSFIGESASMNKIKAVISKIAPSNSTVLITGESGTGKEVVAREIHSLSNCKEGPFFAINIGGVSESLLESELFGYEKGAFTGANNRKIGLFELAEQGTLFLDEIGDMPTNLQVKILRVLQEKKITRLGGTAEIPINARIVAATNKKLEDKVKEGVFREDLFYRLNVVRIEIPALRHRKDDIPLLCAHVISKYNKSMNLSITGFSPVAIAALKEYDFFGNVRELENILERAMIFCESDVIQLSDLDLRSSISREGEGEKPEEINDVLSLKDAERKAITVALHRWEGNRTHAAKELGISRRTLISKIAEYGLD